MGERLILRYDQIGSFLFLELCPPYAEQDSDEIDDAVLARFNLKTGALESIEILFFESWLKLEGEIRIPVTASLRPAGAPSPQAATQQATTDQCLTINYDHSADTLSIRLQPPHPNQRPAEIGKGVTAKVNDATGEIETLAIRAFMARAASDGAVILPISATLRLTQIPVAAD